MIVLDTNVVSEVLRPKPNLGVKEWVQSCKGDVAITAITLSELLAGLRRLPEGKRKRMLTEMIAGTVDPFVRVGLVLPFDAATAPFYADVLFERERSGHPISTADAQIAAICLARGAQLATRNTKDFVRTGVHLIDPWSPSQIEVVLKS